MILSVEHICKAFPGKQVLNDVTFSVEGGRVCGLLGSNGAGKTTLLRIINRILQPDSGCVLFDGHPIEQADLPQVGYLPEERGLYRRMRAGEQAIFLAQLKGMSRRDAEQSLRQWFDRLGIADWWNRPVNRLSKGMQQKLQFVVTVAHRPSLLVLDEPFSGFDSDNSDMLKREIMRLRDEGTAILFSTHNLQAADELCDKTVQL
jgi:ABC-2 type transport system ATP-binding protein